MKLTAISIFMFLALSQAQAGVVTLARCEGKDVTFDTDTKELRVDSNTDTRLGMDDTFYTDLYLTTKLTAKDDKFKTRVKDYSVDKLAINFKSGRGKYSSRIPALICLDGNWSWSGCTVSKGSLSGCEKIDYDPDLF